MFVGRFLPLKIKDKKNGFSIKNKFYSHHGYLIYKEGKKTVTIPCERLTGKTFMIVCLGLEEHWGSPYEKENITSEEWKRIGDNIKNAYKSKGIEVETQYMSLKEYKDHLQSILNRVRGH